MAPTSGFFQHCQHQPCWVPLELPRQLCHVPFLQGHVPSLRVLSTSHLDFQPTAWVPASATTTTSYHTFPLSEGWELLPEVIALWLPPHLLFACSAFNTHITNSLYYIPQV